MDNNNCYCVILAGGAGTRFWPVSKVARPKQFLEFANLGKSFLRMTYERFLKVVPQSNILVITAEKYRDLVLEHIPELAQENLLLEPYSRNTAPCIAYATYTLLSRNPDARVVVTPSDHYIDDEEAFAEVVRDAFEYIGTKDVLMTLGVVPTRPDTNYGYIQACGGRNSWLQTRPMQVKTFTEKPDRDMAKLFISTGEFFWNAGIFVWRASVIKEELEKHLPEVSSLFFGWERVFGTRYEADFVARAYTGCLNISIDYGVMERTDRAWIYPVRFGWSDIGSWESLYNFIQDKDADQNAFNVQDTLTEDTHGVLAISTKKDKLIAIKGLEDYMVIDTDDVLLICPKDDKKYKDFMSGTAMPRYEKYK